jgi:ferredoxin
MHIDIHENRCSGCRLCEQICAITHFHEINPRKALLRVEARFPAPGRYSPELCDQCGACAGACPAEAITEEDGAFRIDPDLCTGCESCLEACPRGLIRQPPGAEAPVKCDLCLECTLVCNTGALVARPDLPARKEVRPCTASPARRCA